MTNTDEQNSSKTNAKISPYSLLSNEIDNNEFYTCSDIEEADRARIYQELLGWPEKVLSIIMVAET